MNKPYILSKDQFDELALSKCNSTLSDNPLGCSCMSDRTNTDLYDLCCSFARLFTIVYWEIGSKSIENTILVRYMSYLIDIKEHVYNIVQKYQMDYDNVTGIAIALVPLCIGSDDIRQHIRSIQRYCDIMGQAESNIANVIKAKE